MYFFKLFISSTGRKTKGKNPVLFADSDKLGNMAICAPVVVENSRLAQMITDFYVKKDKCAYIQIEDQAYQFDERHNPLGLSGMPIFKESLTRFAVGFTISDDLKKIRLDVKALAPEKSVFNGKWHVSFVPSHANFICKVLKKPIEVVIKKK